jgi:hypothetical protein
MAYALIGLGGLIGLVGFAFALFVIIHAFKEAPIQGLLCLFCGPYLLYYSFAKFTHAKKGLIVGGMLASLLVSAVFYTVGGAMVAMEMSDVGFGDARASSDTPSEGAAGDSIGVPECDDYIAKYEACVRDKVPAAGRAQMEQSLQTMRSSWKQAAATPAGKTGLAQGCAQAAAAAKTAMGAYGCQF